MKNINKLFLTFLALATLLVSCEDYENPIYDNVNGNTLVSFSATSYDLAIVIDATGTLEVPVNVSTVSTTDRSFNITVDEDATTALAGSYSVPTSVTIPAGSYTGNLTVTGTDIAGVDTTALSLVLMIGDGANFASGPDATLNVFQVCPIPDDYLVGTYEISDNATVFGGTNFDTRNVDIVAAGATSRSFTTTWSGGSNMNVLLNLVCNNLVYASTNSTGYVAGTPQGPIVIVPASNNTSTYDLSDDSFFVVDYDNQAGGFGTFSGSFFLFKL
jgi:uncharacterized membrane protein